MTNFSATSPENQYPPSAGPTQGQRAGERSEPAASLGKGTCFVTPPSEPGAAGEQPDGAAGRLPVLLRRYSLLNHAQELLARHNIRTRGDNPHRTIGCHRYRVDQARPVSGIHIPSETAGIFANLQKCANAYTCPVCGAKISERRRVELQGGLDSLLEQGYSYAMGTFTLQHFAGEALANVLARLLDSFRKMFAGNPGQRLKERFGLMGFIKSVESPHGANGWHPHLHIIFTFDQKTRLNDVFMADFERALLERWQRVLARQGGYADSQHGFKMTWNVREIAGYVTKMGKQNDWTESHEMTKGAVKRSKDGSSRTPMELLEASQMGDILAGELWIEYVRAMVGRHLLSYTPGLKELMGLTEKSDEEIAEERDKLGVILVNFWQEAWQAVLAHDIRGEVQNILASGDQDYLKAFLAEFGITEGVHFPALGDAGELDQGEASPAAVVVAGELDQGEAVELARLQAAVEEFNQFMKAWNAGAI